MKIDQKLNQLNNMSPTELRAQWTRMTGAPVPKVKPQLLRLALAWELQARAWGGHSRDTIRMLEQMNCSKSRTRKAGGATALNATSTARGML